MFERKNKNYKGKIKMTRSADSPGKGQKLSAGEMRACRTDILMILRVYAEEG
jgi:hypothetical protein